MGGKIPWNKGLNKENEKIKEATRKALISRERYFNRIFQETKRLKDTGLSDQEIAKKMGVTQRAIENRLRRYEESAH